MVLLGTLVNAVAIIIGSLIGISFNRIPDKIKTTVTHGMGLAVAILGIQMGFKSQHTLLMIGSLALGCVIGEWLDLEERLNKLGLWIETKFSKIGKGSQGSIAQGFVTATLVFVVGAMGIVGALNSGLSGDHRVLFTKAMLDGFFSLIFATQLGIGVIFSSVPVFLYEGIIALAATFIVHFIPDSVMKDLLTEITGVGGIMILAIGLNMLGLTKIRTANMLPAIVICVVFVLLTRLF